MREQKLHDQLRTLAMEGRDTFETAATDGGRREVTMGLAWQRVDLLPPRPPRGEHGRAPMKVWA